MAESSLVTLRLDSRTKRRLEQLARATSRSRSFLAAEAIRDYVSLNEWQIEEIKKSLHEANDGDFASEREVKQVLGKWKRAR